MVRFEGSLGAQDAPMIQTDRLNTLLDIVCAAVS